MHFKFALHGGEDAVDRAEDADGRDRLVVALVAVLLLLARLHHAQERLRQVLQYLGGKGGYLVLVDVDETLDDIAHVVVLRVADQIEHLEYDLADVHADVFFHFCCWCCC